MENPSANSGAPAKAGAPHAISIEHHISGRLRVKIPRALGRRNLLTKYADVFRNLVGAQNVSLNASTGCIVIRYHAEEDSAFLSAFKEAYEGEGLVLMSQPAADPEVAVKIAADRTRLLAQHSEFAMKTMTFFNDVDLELKVVSDNTIDLNIALVGGLAIFTFMGIGAAASTPMWVTLALYGINHAVRLQSQGLAAVPVTAPVISTQ